MGLYGWLKKHLLSFSRYQGLRLFDLLEHADLASNNTHGLFGHQMPWRYPPKPMDLSLPGLLPEATDD